MLRNEHTMRYFISLFLLFMVLIDFSATCMADDLIFEGSCVSTAEVTNNDCKPGEDEKSHSSHSSQDSEGHSHVGHIHIALLQDQLSRVNISPLEIELTFLDYNQTVPNSFLKQLVRPPIAI